MRRLPAVLALRCTLALLVIAPFFLAIPPADAARCRYILGFKALHHQIASVIGACVGDEQHNPVNGDALQQTKKGTLVWRKADNQVAFTDGYVTILDGPHGLEQRLNTQRFSWEANPGGLPAVADTPTTASELRHRFTTTSTTRSITCTTTMSTKARARRSIRQAGTKVAPLPKANRQRTACS